MDLSAFFEAIGSYLLSLFGITDAPSAVDAITGFFASLVAVGVGLKALRWGLRR